MNQNIKLPESIEKLKDLSYNLWFSWNPDVRDLFRELDMDLWRESGKNPVEFLLRVGDDTLNKAAANEAFVAKVQKAWERMNEYINRKETRFRMNYPRMIDHQIAYFSAEYGIHESLPNYAGGLGILAGDHTKSASDVGLPLIAIGLMYKHAYFQQQINVHGEQTEIYTELDPNRLPCSLVLDSDGEPLLVSVPLLDHELFIKIWEVKVGRVSVFLLDTNVESNIEEDKQIIHSLYGGTRDTRIRQEIILGIGGMRAIREMDLKPSVFHMNEGHSAFLGLERLYELMNEGMDFKTALEFVRATTIFTTHTPIPAGNEAFELDMIEKYFRNMWPKLEISNEKFFDLGRDTNIHQHAIFSLTVLALNLSSQANGVSKLHGEVSRKMWQKVWPAVPTKEVPIGHVTNGVHTFTWLHREMISLFDEQLGEEWRKNILNQHYWDKIYDIPDEVIWKKSAIMKKEMVDHIRRLYKLRIERYGEDRGGYPAAENILDPNALTIGFARRFAPYKRALLLFMDIDRIVRLFADLDRPVQFLFAGKAHPANDAGKDLIRKLNQYAKERGLEGKVVFVEDYNMSNSRALVTGVDVWLNTPRRPLEASGTSGQKVPINFGLNLSILDGWWIEGYNGENGWAIGSEGHYDDHERQDLEDSKSLYDLLENQVIPLFYKRNKKGLPEEWITMLKHAMHSTITQFSAHRMVWDYLTKYYMPAMRRAQRYAQEEYHALHHFSKWRNRMTRLWPEVKMNLQNGYKMDEDFRILSPGEQREIRLVVESENINPQELIAEVTLERQDAFRGHQDMKVVRMGMVSESDEGAKEYRAMVTVENDGSYRFNCRILPSHPDFYNPHETRLIKWLD